MTTTPEDSRGRHSNHSDVMPAHPARSITKEEEEALSELEAKVNALRENVLSLEARVTELGTAALTMPEDLGDWTDAPPRVSGLITRIMQTHVLSVQVVSLVNECACSCHGPKAIRGGVAGDVVLPEGQ